MFENKNQTNEPLNCKWVPKQYEPFSLAEQQQKNKQFCKEFLSQMTTTIAPADLKDAEHTSQIQQDQTNKKEGMTTANQNSHFTAFEQLLLTHRNTTDLDQQLISDIKRLIEALEKRDKYPGNSKARVTCPKCDQHYWHPIRLKDHSVSCERAQSVKTKLLQHHSTNHDLSPDSPPMQQEEQYELQIPTKDKLNGKQEQATISSLENLTINIEDDTQKWEKEIRWPFITLNSDLLPDLAVVLRDFQQIQSPTMLSLLDEQGIFGTLVDKIARIMQAINCQPFKEYTYLFSLGSFVTGGVQLRYKLLHILLSGISFHKTKTFPELRPPRFIQSNSWLIDEHIEVIRLLLLNKKVLRSSQGGQRLSKTSICMNSFFSRKLLDDPEDAIDWLRSTLFRHDLLFDHALLLKKLCIPVNLANTRWTMIFIDLKH